MNDDDDDDDDQDAKEKEVKYTLDELKSKTVVELKKICKSVQFPVSGKKNELISRILFPRQYIAELKRRYHYNVICKTSL